jgi:hypothetical protein
MQQTLAIPVLLLLCCWPAGAAEKLAPLDAEFLEYLASFGSEEEDWAWFADDEPVEEQEQPRQKSTAAEREANETEAAVKPAEKR